MLAFVDRTPEAPSKPVPARVVARATTGLRHLHRRLEAISPEVGFGAALELGWALLQGLTHEARRNRVLVAKSWLRKCLLKSLAGLATAGRLDSQLDLETTPLLNHGWTPLFCLVQFWEEDVVGPCVRRALALGADPGLKCAGSTPLHEASALGCRSAVRALLRAGADPEALDGHRDTPLFQALVQAPRPGVVSDLLRAGAQVKPDHFLAALDGLGPRKEAPLASATPGRLGLLVRASSAATREAARRLPVPPEFGDAMRDLLGQ